MIFPRPLVPGDTIGVTAPAKWSEEPQLRAAAAGLERAGYRVHWGETNWKRDGQFAGTERERARELEAMLADPRLRAVLCARGGYGSSRVADEVRWDRLEGAEAKIFAGFSDVTSLLLTLTRRTGWVTFHGPMLYSLDGPQAAWNLGAMLGVFTGRTRTLDLAGARVLRPGRARGPLWGGNLTLLVDRLGTPEDLDTRGAVLFVEETKEPVYKIDRMFQHLRRAGKLREIAALVLGEMTGFPPDEIPFGRTVDEIALEALEGRPVPVVADAPCGHGARLLTFPLSLPVALEADCGRAALHFLESPVR